MENDKKNMKWRAHIRQLADGGSNPPFATRNDTKKRLLQSLFIFTGLHSTSFTKYTLDLKLTWEQGFKL